MPAIACLAFADWMRFIMTLTQIHVLDALLGTLPFVLPLTLMVLLWIFDPEKRIMRIIGTILLMGLCVFWAIDMPRSMQEAKDLQIISESYQKFYQDIQDHHQVSWYDAPEALISGKIHSEWQYKPVGISDYNIDKDILDIFALYYVEQVDIVIPGMKAILPVSIQEIKFSTLEQISLHYFYKYSTERHIMIGDFQYSGDAFFLVQHENGEQAFVDNVLIRKKDKERE
jgi:Ca2+/Na+ antiporter